MKTLLFYVLGAALAAAASGCGPLHLGKLGGDW